MAILLPQRVAVTLTHGDVWSCPGSGGEQRTPLPLLPAGRHDRAPGGRSQARRTNEIGIRMREPMILVLAGGRLAPHVTALSEQPKRGALHHHHERAPHERGSRDVYLL